MKNRYFIMNRLALLLFFISGHFISMAQADPNCDPLDPACPIDDYYGMLIFVLLVFAAYKAYKRRKIVMDL